MAVGVDLVDHEIVAFDPSQFPQLAAETFDIGMGRNGEPADAGGLNLRVRRERPRRRRAADQRDKIAPLQSIELHLLPQPTRGQHIA